MPYKAYFIELCSLELNLGLTKILTTEIFLSIRKECACCMRSMYKIIYWFGRAWNRFLFFAFQKMGDWPSIITNSYFNLIISSFFPYKTYFIELLCSSKFNLGSTKILTVEVFLPIWKHVHIVYNQCIREFVNLK